MLIEGKKENGLFYIINMFHMQKIFKNKVYILIFTRIYKFSSLKKSFGQDCIYQKNVCTVVLLLMNEFYSKSMLISPADLI